MSDHALDTDTLRAAADDLARHDVALVTLDSLRFDVAAEAAAPNLKALGPLRRATSYGSFTLPSHAAIFGGFLPDVTEEPQWDFYSRELRQLWRLSRARRQAVPRASMLLNGDNIVEGFGRAGYRTVGAGGVRWFSSGYFPGLFDTFRYWGPDGDDTDKFAERGFGDFALDHVEELVGEVAATERSFLFVNAAETHAPYTRGTDDPFDTETQRIARSWSGSWNGGAVVPFTTAARKDMARLREAQRVALESVDRKLGRLFDALTRPTVVVVCADHGEAFGEKGWWGHNQPMPEVMSVPMWIGVLHPSGCQTAVP
ncbi:sulfatase-like hydrolase/transferase [Streptomyces sp. GbtcB6]|uniref:sulfatase-like hydrolase/transferase n=1 Tax=Streptomyces sp. GbtcB6 TaxID=2824751 RepID=UPI001C2FB54D|nr:sulfatase-like hydrolase/transferase [Streptomyces sp. GbtcB6]